MSLVFDGIHKRVGGETHLAAINAEFQPGLNVIIGPTLSGKTSILRLIAGLDKANAGDIRLHGKSILHLPVQKRKVAIVYQQYINYPNFTVYDNIASPLRLAKLNQQEIDSRVREVAELLRINDYLQRLPSELSGGQQQRTAIARALVKQADVVLLDEPLVNLDYKLREELRREMRTIFAEKNTLAIYATTEPLEASLLGKNLVVLDKGQVLQVGAGKTLLANPADLRTAEILSDPKINSIHGQVKNGVVIFNESISFETSVLRQAQVELSDGEYQFAIRPHHLQIVNSSQKSPTNNNAEAESFIRVQAKIELAEVSGSETLVHVQFGDTSWIVQQLGVHQYQLDQEVWVGFDPADLHVFDSRGGSVSTVAKTEKGAA